MSRVEMVSVVLVQVSCGWMMLPVMEMKQVFFSVRRNHGDRATVDTMKTLALTVSPVSIQ